MTKTNKKKIKGKFFLPPTPKTSFYHLKHLAEVKKPLLILFITIGALIILSLVVFFAPQLVGRAAYQVGDNSVGIRLEESKKVVVFAYLTATTNGVYFELTSLTEGFDLCTALGGDLKATVINGLWHQFEEIFCTNGRLIFGDATLNEEKFKDKNFIIATLTPAFPEGMDTLTLSLNPVDIYDSSNGQDLFPDGQEFTLTILPCTPGQTRECGSEAGECEKGTQTCQKDGTWEDCAGAVAPAAEICDSKDNDCDEKTDEEPTDCAPDQICQDGSCLVPAECTSDEDCAEDLVCQEGICVEVSECTADLDCSEGYACQEGFCQEEAVTVTTEGGTPSGGGGGGGGRGCKPKWSCDPWTPAICDITLTQNRTCHDQKCGTKPTKENRSCQPCEESWVCSLWSDCRAGRQSRECYDEHNCGAFAKKPLTQKACETPDISPFPAQTVEVLPEEFIPPQLMAPQPTFWDQYKGWLIGLPTILGVIALAVFLYLHFFRQPPSGLGEAANLDELKSWIGQVKRKGATPEQIKALALQSGWTEKDLQKVRG